MGGRCSCRAALPLRLSAAPKPGLSHRGSRGGQGQGRRRELGDPGKQGLLWRRDQPREGGAGPLSSHQLRGPVIPSGQMRGETEAWDVLGNPTRKGQSPGGIRPVHLQAVTGSAGSSHTPKEREPNWCPLSVCPETAPDSVTGGNRFPRELNQPFW